MGVLYTRCSVVLTTIYLVASGKKADSVVQRCVFSHISPENSRITNEYICNKCSVFEGQLKETLAEFSSAQLIINILQKE